MPKLFVIFLLFLSSALFAQAPIINEVCAENNRFVDDLGETSDWIEIYNPGAENIDLAGFYLSDDSDNLTKHQISGGLLLPPQSFLLLHPDGKPAAGITHLGFKINGSETVYLSSPQAELLSALPTSAAGANTSFGRITDGGSSLQTFAYATPGSPNSDGIVYRESTPTFSLPHGAFSPGATLALSAPPTAEIRYTTDGSRPDLQSSLYTAPLLLTEPIFIRAVAFYPDNRAGLPAESFFYPAAAHALPVLHLAVEPALFTGADWGIYVRGNNGTPGSCSSAPANWHRDWQRDARFFWSEAEEDLQAAGKVKIGGGCSRNIVMKSLIFEFDTRTDYPFFSHHAGKKYKKIKLRGSGHDFIQTHFRDGLLQEMLRDKSAIDLQAYRPVVTYINGTYFGVFNAREVADDNYLQTHYDFLPGQTDIIKLPYHATQPPEVRGGDLQNFAAFTAFWQEQDLSDADIFAEFKTLIDYENLTDYYLAEVFLANFDWPGNNMTMWRERSPAGKWRWMLYDLDASTHFGLWSVSHPYYDSWRHAAKPTAQHPEGTTLFAAIQQNKNYRDDFLQRLCSTGQIVFPRERVRHFTDSIRALLSPEMPAHIAFWNNRPAAWGAGNPVGGSLETWEAEVTRFLKFFEVRTQFFTDRLNEQLSLSGKFDLILNFFPDTPGKVVLHDNRMLPPYAYKGFYFKKLPLRVEAIPNAGYEFVHWEETRDTNAVLVLRATKDTELTPVFQKKEEPIFAENLTLMLRPNPALRHVYLDVQAAAESPGKLTVFTAAGTKILQSDITVEKTVTTEELLVRHLPRGVYLVTVTTGSETVTQKLLLR